MSLKSFKIPPSEKNTLSFLFKKCSCSFFKNPLLILKYAHKQSSKSSATFFKLISFVKVFVTESHKSFKTKSLSLISCKILTISSSQKKICFACVKNCKIKMNQNTKNFSWFSLMLLGTILQPPLPFVSCHNSMSWLTVFWTPLDFNLRFHKMCF